MNAPVEIMPAHALAHLVDDNWLDAMSPEEQAVLPWCFDLWLRPDQYLPSHHWRMCGLDGGRGFGKTWCVGTEINGRVERGEESHILLMAPTEARVEQVQIKALIETAPPWFRPERYRGGLRWPNGVKALTFTPEAPGRTRGENASLSWLTEIVDWNAKHRVEAFDNITTATRIGRAQIIWDSTSKGRNDLLSGLRAANASDPEQNPIIHGTMFDNLLLTVQYLRAEYEKYTGVRRDEEIFGLHFDEAAGASWRQADLNRTRVEVAPDFDWECIGLDPAQSTNDGSDETGILRGGHGRADGHAYLVEDRTGKYAPEEWGDITVSMCRRGGRVVVERNHLGDNAVYVLRSRAENVKLLVKTIGKDEPWPALDPRCIHVREVVSRESKSARAEGPAAETEAGRVHLVGEFPDLEREMTTFVPGIGLRSPNRFDAAVFTITELRGLALERAKADGAQEIRAAVAAQKQIAQAVSGSRYTAANVSRVRARRGGL
jgi:phage terminase large subunit-like protein